MVKKKNLPTRAGDARDQSKETQANGRRSKGSISGSGRSPGEGNGNPLQDSCLEIPMDRGLCQATAHGVAESDTTERLSYE